MRPCQPHFLSPDFITLVLTLKLRYLPWALNSSISTPYYEWWTKFLIIILIFAILIRDMSVILYYMNIILHFNLDRRISKSVIHGTDSK